MRMTSFVVALGAVALVAGMAAAERPVKELGQASTAAIVGPAHQAASASSRLQESWDFEPAAGFTPGYIAGQNGWTAFAASATQPTVSTANPAGGVQHLRVAQDPAVGTDTNIGAFSPEVTDTVVDATWMAVDVAVSATGGADYYVLGQAPSQGFVTAYFRFYYLGDIVVLDNLGAGAVWVDTGVDWTPGPYVTVRMDVDPVTSTIEYRYGGSLIYTGALFAGTTIEEVVLFDDNWNLNDVGDFDNLQIERGQVPVELVIFEVQ